MEKWKRYKDTKYFVSNLGRVFSEHKMKTFKCGMMKLWGDGRGYLSVAINGVKIKVHRLVAFCFCENHEHNKEVNHKNFITTDNKAENLEWVTPAQNINHLKEGKGISNQFSKSKPVVQYDLEFNEIKQFKSELEAAKFIGITNYKGKSTATGIKSCCEYKLKTHRGFIWRYKGEKNMPVLKERHPLAVKVVLEKDGKKYYFDSTNDASRELGVPRKGISAVLSGRQNRVYGYSVRKQSVETKS